MTRSSIPSLSLVDDAVQCLADDAALPLFRFTVSRDEEHVHLVMEDGKRVVDLGERIHHYALLILVRRNIDDVLAGRDTCSCGWTDRNDLARMLGLDPCHLAVQMFRLRRQLFAAGLTHALIERRRGQLRAVGMSVSIVQGGGTMRAQLSGPIRFGA
ncbi:hypothetical protein [Massilia sp. CCM 8734]|uniref:hypothetical protein n=1 Tax=Massilia sp. CCM 8734 TaxID=2609283 RepID=UPI00142181B1|nr:hypothetical protein [Massilia sp. CCM 8734]NIA00811.1 hypothetical protein [Massilia sp. CCM 8734]